MIMVALMLLSVLLEEEPHDLFEITETETKLLARYKHYHACNVASQIIELYHKRFKTKRMLICVPAKNTQPPKLTDN